LPFIGKLTSWPLANLTKIVPRSCHAFRARLAEVLGPFLFDETSQKAKRTGTIVQRPKASVRTAQPPLAAGVTP
jgi:hypothetical protein